MYKDINDMALNGETISYVCYPYGKMLIVTTKHTKHIVEKEKFKFLDLALSAWPTIEAEHLR